MEVTVELPDLFSVILKKIKLLKINYLFKGAQLIICDIFSAESHQ